MVTVKDYTKMVLKIEEVGSYLLMRTDGQILSHNVPDPDGLSSLLALSNLGIKTLQQSLGFQHFNHLLIKRDNQENLVLLKLGNSLLGILQRPNTACSELLNSLVQIQEQINAAR
jgi:nanoRNase/pAp phosphatase (c-di-AMP/oligoRNAs hydrolase)